MVFTQIEIAKVLKVLYDGMGEAKKNGDLAFHNGLMDLRDKVLRECVIKAN